MATGGLEEGGEAGKDARLRPPPPPLRRPDDPRPFKRYQLKTDPGLGAYV